jgi:hypothetical protein
LLDILDTEEWTMLARPCTLTNEKLRISLVDLSGETNIRYTPLAIMCIKAGIESTIDLRCQTTVRLHAFLQSHTVAEMAAAIIKARPHVIGFSCQGWNMRQLGMLFGTVRQYLPNALIIIGGNHATNQTRFLEAFSAIDIIVNGEGEFTFCDILRWVIDESVEPSKISGISFRNNGQIVTTPARHVTREMEQLPSPYLAGDLGLEDYDVALLETNRGCPYHCGFCYWGGRVGQKLARSGLDRVREEIETIGRAGIETIFLCDANFGILEQDLEIARIVVDTKRAFGAPREFNVNWAKNHAPRVGEIIRILMAGEIHTAINIPLQTWSKRALAASDRTEMGREAMIAEALSLIKEGNEIYCELIFGMPGESLQEFKINYDILFSMFPVLRIHPLWILPNTTYDKKRVEFGIRTISPDLASDYEAVFEHNDLTSDDMRDGLALLLAHSNLNLLGIARNSLRAYVQLTNASASVTLIQFERFLRDDPSRLGRDLYGLYLQIRRACYFERGLRDVERRLLYRSADESISLLRNFFESLPMPADVLSVCCELVRYDVAMLPRGDLDGNGFVESKFEFAFDPILASRFLQSNEGISLLQKERMNRTLVTVRHKAGLSKLNGSNCDLTGSWNGRVISREAITEIPLKQQLRAKPAQLHSMPLRA